MDTPKTMDLAAGDRTQPERGGHEVEILPPRLPGETPMVEQAESRGKGMSEIQECNSAQFFELCERAKRKEIRITGVAQSRETLWKVSFEKV